MVLCSLYFPFLLRFVLQDHRDAGVFRFLAPVPGLELAAAAHRPDPVCSGQVVADPRNCLFVAAQTVDLDFLRLPLENS